jgi:hypothetical protein
VISSTTKTIAAAFVVAAALGATTAQAASAKGGDGVRVAGTCSDSSTSKLKLKRDNGRLQVEFEVDQNRNAVPWTVELRKDGRLVFQGTRLTAAPSGSFSLERRIAGTSGTILARASRNGETCSASARPGKIATSAKVASQGTNGAAGGSAVSDDGVGHDVNDDHGNHVTDGSGHDVNDDSGHHGNDD